MREGKEQIIKLKIRNSSFSLAFLLLFSLLKQGKEEVIKRDRFARKKRDRFYRFAFSFFSSPCLSKERKKSKIKKTLRALASASASRVRRSPYAERQLKKLEITKERRVQGERLTEKGKYFLYIYGANCYNENNINKKIFEDRYNWVISNLDKIYSMEKDFIIKAESPALFAAFCIAMKKMRDNPDYLHFHLFF